MRVVPVAGERLTSGSNGPGLALLAPAAEPGRSPHQQRKSVQNEP